MSKSVKINGVTYESVPQVSIPLSPQGAALPIFMTHLTQRQQQQISWQAKMHISGVARSAAP